jgi:excisionase family DNA binding protein
MSTPIDAHSLPRTIPEVAEQLRELGIEVSSGTLYRLVRRGELPATEVGGRLRSTVAAYLDALTPSQSIARAGAAGFTMDAGVSRGGR